MSGLYIAIPKASNAVVEVALANGAKTVLQVKPVTQDAKIHAWGISSDGSAVGAGIVAELIDVDVAATVTSLTPETYEHPNDQAARAVGGTTATGYNASAEGSITASRILDATELRPDGDKYVLWFPKPPTVKAARFARVRTVWTATTVNVLPWIIFEEVG